MPARQRPAASAHPTAGQRARSIGQWDSLLKRYPMPSPLGLGVQVLLTLAGNGLVVWLVANGLMTPFELVLLVALEALLLISLAWGQSRLVPPEAREPPTMTPRDRLNTMLFAALWLGGVYSICLLVMLRAWPEALAAVRDPIGFFSTSAIRWPLLLTALLALIDALQDWRFFRRHGGIFLSTPGFQGAARWLTLFLGGIPFATPFFTVAIGAIKGGEALVRYVKVNTTRKVAVAVGAFLLVCIVLYSGLPSFIESATRDGVSMWALGYCAAKVCAELFIVCLPLIASKARAEEIAATTIGKTQKKTRR